MIVISDSSPLNYLILLGQADLLEKLYGKVFIPPAVYDELQRTSTPSPVQLWMARPPEWLKIQSSAIPADASLSRLGPGEREAIALAENLHADAILIDERDGRRIAEHRRLTVVGTLQVLNTAAEHGLVDIPTVFSQLQKTSFRASARLLNIFLQRDIERKRKS